MDIFVLDDHYDTLGIVDSFKSLIWTERYIECGDFEIYLPAEERFIQLFKRDRFVAIRESEVYMLIEDIQLETDPEDGDYITISGRSLKGLLDRRIVWKSTILKSSFQDGIEKLLNENLITPSDPMRKIPGFRFKRSADPRIMELQIETQFYGQTLLEAIESLCLEADIGYRILPEENGGMVFELYAGTDRSYSQDKNPWVVFSPSYDNLSGSNYVQSFREYKNSALVGGFGEGNEQITAEVATPVNGKFPEGLSRRECYLEAPGVSPDKTESGNDLYDQRYVARLAFKGLEELAKIKTTETFDGEIEYRVQYIYGTDYIIGDVAQVVNAYGMNSAVRITEIARGYDDEGYTIIPTFVHYGEETP